MLGLRLVAVVACLALMAGVSRYPNLVDASVALNIICFILVTVVVLMVPLRPATEYTYRGGLHILRTVSVFS